MSKPRVTVHVSGATRDRTDGNRRVARVSVSRLNSTNVSFKDINDAIKLEDGMTFFTTHALLFISGTSAQTGRFLPIVIAAVEAAGYEVTNK